MSRHLTVAFAIAFAPGCTTSFTDDTPIVSTPRLLAVQATPAESPVGGAFSLDALYVGPEGPADGSSIDWAICSLAKPLGDPGPVNPACFVNASGDLTPLGDGPDAQGVVPEDACELFGPDSPPPEPGQPSARPTDPDSTGGFYLPIRVSAAGGWSAVLDRISCRPAGVTQEVFTAFLNGYHPNANPIVTALTLAAASSVSTLVPPDAPGASPGASVSPGERVTLAVSWPACSPDATACGGAETFSLIDPSSKELTTQRESMVASWYATGGAFDVDSSGTASSDLSTGTTNVWTAPASPGTFFVWVVLRDSRGGVGWSTYRIAVTE